VIGASHRPEPPPRPPLCSTVIELANASVAAAAAAPPASGPPRPPLPWRVRGGRSESARESRRRAGRVVSVGSGGGARDRGPPAGHRLEDERRQRLRRRVWACDIVVVVAAGNLARNAIRIAVKTAIRDVLQLWPQCNTGCPMFCRSLLGNVRQRRSMYHGLPQCNTLWPQCNTGRPPRAAARRLAGREGARAGRTVSP
jgi:hypothetical protein